jgi:Cache domain
MTLYYLFIHVVNIFLLTVLSKLIPRHNFIILVNEKLKMVLKKSLILSCLLAIIVFSFSFLPLNDHTDFSNISQEAIAQESSLDNLGVQNQTKAKMTITDRSLVVKLLAESLESRINKSAAVLEVTSKLPQIRSVSYANFISPELHGISNDLDIPKRKVAQDILTADPNFEVIFFLMPNGDMYMEEPYSNQQNLTRNNFAFRDYYIGAVNTNNTFLGNVIISASSGRPQAYIAIPVYSENNGTFIGVWSGGLNLTLFSESLQSLNLTNDGQHVVYIDQQGQKIADSDKQSLLSNGNQNELFANLQSFKNAVKGESSFSIETINGNRMLIFYTPMKFHSTTWAVLFMQHYN